MEQTDSSKRHRHTIFITGLDHVVITDGTAWLGDVFHTALICPVDVIAEWEERVRA